MEQNTDEREQQTILDEIIPTGMNSFGDDSKQSETINAEGEYIQQPYQQNNNSSYQQNSAHQQGDSYQQNSGYQQGGGYPQYYGQGTEHYSQYQNYKRSSSANGNNGIGFGIASMIMGIVSLLLFCTCINIPVAVAAIIFGIIYLCSRPESKVYGIVGIITAALSILCFVAMIALAWVPVQAYYEQIEDSIDLYLPDGSYDGEDIFEDDFYGDS